MLPIIRHHHEKLGGTGYPDGLRGEQIPITARILQIADLFDSLVTRRPYKPPLTTAEALDRIGEEVQKGWRDPRLFEEFKYLLRDGILTPRRPAEKALASRSRPRKLRDLVEA